MGSEFSNIFARLKLWVLIAWLGAIPFFLYERWGLIRGFVLSDTDDNMRMMQVRGLLHGQGWFDLRQYRLDPPDGADMHWSRFVDLPIAGINLLLRPFVSGAAAEQAAAALAPMLPMGLAIFAIALIAQRVIAPKALLVGLLMLACAHATRAMWLPMRVDHHGWQLALLSIAMLGLVDPNRRRGGAVLGLATALSLIIGLEMLIYLAVGGAVVGLVWIYDGKGERLATYGATLAGGCAIGYLLFASYANRAPVCDALSPVWVTMMGLAGALCLLLAIVRPDNWMLRLGAGLLAALVLGGAYAWLWPHCLGRLEGVSDRANYLWLSRVREAQPVYSHPPVTITAFVTLPIAGLVGYAVMLWTSRKDSERFMAWAGLAALALSSCAVLFWQTRAGPAANLLAVPGAAGLAWLALIAIHRSKHAIVRVIGTVIGFLLVSGIGPQLAAERLLPKDEGGRNRKAVGTANARCPSMAALKPIAKQPKGYVLTFVDLGPRLITVTHHDAVAGPYHRNDDAIVDVMESFLGTPERAHETVRRRGIDYVLICPMMSESTNYQVRAPQGFYAQLAKNKVPSWLTPVELPKDSPYKMWRVTEPRPRPQAPVRPAG